LLFVRDRGVRAPGIRNRTKGCAKGDTGAREVPPVLNFARGAGVFYAASVTMKDVTTDRGHGEEIEAALLDAELFLKYNSPQRAAARLAEAILREPRSIRLRESLRGIAAANDQREEAARQCLALAGLYIEREDFDAAQERLLEARSLDPRLSVAKGLEAVRRARRPDLAPAPAASRPARPVTFAGDLSVVSIFDAVQVIENARLTGALNIEGGADACKVLFNDGRIVGAQAGAQEANAAQRRVLEQTDGAFEFERSAREFPVTIQAHSNTNLLLDTLRELDEERAT
jgi:tetratricopeptide (TPR) repeat protein